MRTIKEAADLAGVSVRTLQYYDKLGVLKPAGVNAAGYRFYDDAALEKLQQILFFRELDFPLKTIREIMETGAYNPTELFQKQKQLLTIKRDRLNRMLDLLERLEKGETVMSFKEFDMSEYINALEQFKCGNEDQVVKHWGSVEKFEEFVRKIKEDETNVAKLAIKQFGSIEKYTEAMKYNLGHFSELMEQADKMRENADEMLEKNNALYAKLTADLSRDVTCEEVQQAVAEIVAFTEMTAMGTGMGEGYWDIVIESYSNETVQKIMEQKYGEGTAEYIAEAFRCYFDGKDA